MKKGKNYPAITSKMPRFTINAAGKNFSSFDLQFLKTLPGWQKCIQIRQRTIDPAVLYTDWFNDKSLPSLPLCKKRSGLKEEVSHDALEDAWDVVQVLRKFYMK
jgi:hypothetical protein